jgi:hypothetical protein
MNLAEAELAGFVPRSANGGVTYTARRWAFRLHLHYTSDQLFQFHPSPVLRQYLYARRPVDISVKYNLNARISLFADAINAFRSPVQRRYMYVPGREMGHDWFSPIIKFGLNARL